ncbi:glutathione S-transferase family protein [Hahella aquimaris]|uniref:glutathione S-transferase family protein n=1 Tax=Hahella sp. HNIBRBA332 TaxID=3015983 RepID=UPI00273C85A7|nr:glutathione S-transferase family protein [Hahella sp. HNIBRBA332]WLQ15970.1 glutathione S-transferase family protein [Hahella sp. HNIBRBA332]
MSIGAIELVSFKLCPYVQRSVITLLEKGVAFKRTAIDLANKPGWFLALSPTGKVPLLVIDNKDVIFESAVICEYLDEVTEGSLLPADPKLRAFHRSWIEFGSQTLDAIGRYYSAQDKESFRSAEELLRRRFERLEEVGVGPYFSGADFMIADAVYAPVFRYFDVFNSLIKIDLFKGLAKVEAWRRQMAARQSVIDAVDADFAQALIAFVIRKQSYLSHLLQAGAKG